MVTVAVGDVNLIRLGIRHHVGGAAEPRLRRRAFAAVILADLLEEFSLWREFQDLVAVVVAAEPDIAVAVDVNAVLVLHPRLARGGAAPGGEQIALGIEFQNRRRGFAALGFRRIGLRTLLIIKQGGRTMDDPDVVLAVHGDAGDLAKDPVFRQRLRPERLGLEFRGGLLGRGDRRQQRSRRDRKPRQDPCCNPRPHGKRV